MARIPDPAHVATDKIIAELEKKITKEYKQAQAEIAAKTDDYMRRFKIKDKKWQEWVKDSKKTAEEYKKWRIGQMAIGKRWEEMIDTIAHDLYNTSKIAKSMANHELPTVYAINHDYATFEVEKGSLIDTSYTLYSRETAERILRDNPQMLPAPGKKVMKDIAEGRAVRWNNQHIQSVMMQALLQGESIPEIATRLSTAVCDSDRKAAIRNARTMATSAQNAGRVDAYNRGRELGIEVEDIWIATLDMRTRHEHRLLYNQKRGKDGYFHVDGYKIEYPGDFNAPGFLVWNCRCTLRGEVKGLERRAHKLRSTKAIEGQTYEQWRESKKVKTNPIDLPEKKAKAIKAKYIKEYREL